MKKSLIIGLLVAGFIGSTFAANTFRVKQNRASAPQEFTSMNESDVVTVQSAMGEAMVKLIINVSKGSYDSDGSVRHATGIYVRNCGAITHVNPGSTVICDLSTSGDVATVSFNADKSTQDSMAFGKFQIQ